MNRIACFAAALWMAGASFAFAQEQKPGKISWKKIVLDTKFRSEGVGVADVNKDGKLDVIVGDCWYEAPKDPAGDWKRHILRADRVFKLDQYSDSFCCFTDDFNADGYPDVIVIPFPGNPCYWYENPGPKGGHVDPPSSHQQRLQRDANLRRSLQDGQESPRHGLEPAQRQQRPQEGQF